jgi:hypothetical protein
MLKIRAEPPGPVPRTIMPTLKRTESISNGTPLLQKRPLLKPPKKSSIPVLLPEDMPEKPKIMLKLNVKKPSIGGMGEGPTTPR